MLKYPNLFVVGSPKCGTTTFYNYLAQHPNITMSREKEPAFFDKDVYFDCDGVVNKKAKEGYLRQYEHTKNIDTLYLGDGTPMMVFPKVPLRIKKMCGKSIKIIVLLRNPADRAYSHYWHGYRLGLESGDVNTDFDNLLANEVDPESVRDTGNFPKYYLLNGRYWLHIQRYVQAFGRGNVLLLDFSELVTNHNLVMRKVWKFLGVPSCDVTPEYVNSSQLPRFPWLQSFVAGSSWGKRVVKSIVPSLVSHRVGMYILNRNLKQAKYPAMSLALREKLEAYYYQDNCYLADMYDFDVSKWGVYTARERTYQ